jgi:hypothetical protein
MYTTFKGSICSQVFRDCYLFDMTIGHLVVITFGHCKLEVSKCQVLLEVEKERRKKEEGRVKVMESHDPGFPCRLRKST